MKSSIILAALLLLPLGKAQQPASPDIRQLLTQIAQFKPNPCGPPYERDDDPSELEFKIFSQVDDIVVQALNSSAQTPPRERAREALHRIELLSTELNSAWPQENRFDFEILDIPPALVTKLSIRAHESFSVFGIPEQEGAKPNHLWRRVGGDDLGSHDRVVQIHFKLHTLHRGPSHHARFLVKSAGGGCAGSRGLGYDAREWDPRGYGDLAQFIKQDGASSEEEPGKLRTSGPQITLPYCWFSSVDTWDNPTLCAVDTYDLSGNDVRFRSRDYKDPDLLSIAKAIEYAGKHDYRAVRGYCASAAIARKLTSAIPPYVFAGDLQVTRTGAGRKRVRLAGYRFDVEKRAGHWLVTGFAME